MSFLQGRCKIHRLQGHQHAAKAADQPRQDILSEAQRQLRGLSEKSEKGNQARPIHGAAAVYNINFANRMSRVANGKSAKRQAIGDMR